MASVTLAAVGTVIGAVIGAALLMALSLLLGYFKRFDDNHR